jgi:hypothetical protein
VPCRTRPEHARNLHDPLAQPNVRRIVVIAVVPQEDHREPGHGQGRRQELERQRLRERQRHALGQREHEIGLRDHERRGQEVRDEQRDAPSQPALGERVIGRSSSPSSPPSPDARWPTASGP